VPPDERHPLGHTRELYFWSFVVALLIFTGGAGMSIYEGVVHIRDGEMPTRPVVNYAVLAASFVFESVSLSFAVREFLRSKDPRASWIESIEQSKDPTIFVVLMEDTAALTGLIVAAVFIGLALLTGNPLWDGLGSVVIGLILAGVALILARECKKLLIGEEASPALQRRLRSVAEHHSGVCVVNDVVTVHLGPQDVVAMLNLDFEDDLPLSEVERIIEDIEEVVKVDFPEIRWFYVRPQSSEAARARREAVRQEIVEEWAE
jgi:divalent metal cation (Fe/Co/Zn/Cd) transporter